MSPNMSCNEELHACYIKRGYRFCTYCRKELDKRDAKPEYCQHHDIMIKDNFTYCYDCGRELNKKV